MTAGRLPRRLIVGATSAALLAGAVGFVPLLGSASAACTPSYTDPAGDAVLVADGAAVPGVVDLGNDTDLDILDVTHSVDAGVFSSTVHVQGLTDFGPVVSFVDEFDTLFTVNGKAVEVDARRSHSMAGLVGAAAETDTATLKVAGTATSTAVKMVVDLKASTVTTQIAVPAFETALGGALTGRPFSVMSAVAKQIFNVSDANSPGLANSQDTATAPASAAYAFGASCSGGSTPAATGSGTPSPSPTPSTTPTTTPGGLFDQPRKGCVQYKDATGDAQPDPAGADQEDALDVTQVNLKSPTGQLQVYVGLVDPSAALFPLFSGP